MVIGAGGLGLMCVTILKAMGGKGAVVVDIDEKRRAAAREAGALAAVDGAAPDALKQGDRRARGALLGGDRLRRRPKPPRSASTRSPRAAG